MIIPKAAREQPTALVLESDPVERHRLAALVERANIPVVATCATTDEALAVLRQHDVSLIFADQGIEMLRRRAGSAGHRNGARLVRLDAPDDGECGETEVRLDRPYQPAAVSRCCDQLTSGLAAHSPDDAHPPAMPSAVNGENGSWLRRVPVEGRDQVDLIPVERIDWLEAEDMYVRLHCGERTHLVRDKIGALADALPPHLFVRVHRSTIVNKSRVRGLRRRPDGGREVVLQDGTKLSVARSRRGAVEKELTFGP